ncbi:MAG: helix-turn-helix transcriptional regulator [Gammaproteobacteria bacterium]|nr:helix-turn-helix transcriptional regulator [Gammaproteobacteria bacterium]
MPAKSPEITPNLIEAATSLGAQIRARRKALGVSAVVASESAGMSRVTWHRIEKGEPSVTMGAWLSAAAALGLTLTIPFQLQEKSPEYSLASRDNVHEGWLPARVRLDDYPQLKQLAWQIHGVDALTPVEALGIYERNWRHLDEGALSPHERQLIAALRLAFDKSAHHV